MSEAPACADVGFKSFSIFISSLVSPSGPLSAALRKPPFLCVKKAGGIQVNESLKAMRPWFFNAVVRLVFSRVVLG
jgi:hypothetical protein